MQMMGVACTVKSERFRPDRARPAATAGVVCWRTNVPVWNGWIRTPSPTSAAFAVIWGPSAATHTGGGPYGFGPGSKNGVIRVWR